MDGEELIDDEQIIGKAVIAELSKFIDLEDELEDLGIIDYSDMLAEVGKIAMESVTLINEQNLARQRAKEVEKLEYIYFIGGGETIKIGRSVNPEKRLREIQTGHPHKLELLASVRGDSWLEAHLHRQFHKHRLSGEWFNDVSELREYISGIKLSNPSEIRV